MKSAVLGVTAAISFFMVTSFIDVNSPRMIYGSDSFINRVLSRIEIVANLYEITKVPYTKGNNDCSGTMTKIVGNILRKAGIGGFPRTTSRKMWIVWPGVNYTGSKEVFERGQFPDILWFTYSPKRPRGHVTLIRTNEDGGITFSEASSSKKYFKRTRMKKGDYRYNHIYGSKILDLTPGFEVK